MKPTVLPESFLRRMSSEDRAPMGKAGLTMPEIDEASAIKLERELHREIGQDLLRRGIEYGHSRFGLKSRYTPGFPDFIFTVNHETWHVECKVPGNGLDPDQRRVRDNILANGGLWLTAYQFADYAVIFHVGRITGRME